MKSWFKSVLKHDKADAVATDDSSTNTGAVNDSSEEPRRASLSLSESHTSSSAAEPRSPSINLLSPSRAARTANDSHEPTDDELLQLCSLNFPLTLELTRTSFSSIVSVIDSIEAMLANDRSRYQSLLRDAGILDIMITNLSLWYTQFARAFNDRQEQSVMPSFTRQPSQPFSPPADALDSIIADVRKRQEMHESMMSPRFAEVQQSPSIKRMLSGTQPLPALIVPATESISPAPSPVHSPSHTQSLSISQLVRIVTVSLDMLASLLANNATNQELFSNSSGPAILLSLTVYPPTATPAIRLVQTLLTAHHRVLESQSVSASVSPLLGDAYMLSLLHLLYQPLPPLAYQLPFYRLPPTDPTLLAKPSYQSLATHPSLLTHFPLPSVTSVEDTESVLRSVRLLQLVRRCLAASHCAQQSFGRVRGFERVFAMLKGLTQVNSDSQAASLFLVQEVLLAFMAAMRGNDRNSHYPYPRPFPSHYHLTNTHTHTGTPIGFHTVGYRRLYSTLKKTGLFSDYYSVDLLCNWLLWFGLEYQPNDNELIATPSLSCQPTLEQRETELSEESPLASPSQSQSEVTTSSKRGSLLRVNTDNHQSLIWCWWEDQQQSVSFTVIDTNKLILSSNHIAYHPYAIKLAVHCLSMTSAHMARRVTVLLYLLTKNNAVNAMTLGQCDVLTPLIKYHRQTLLTHSDTRSNNDSGGGSDSVIKEGPVLDLITALLPFTPSSAPLHSIFQLFEHTHWPAYLVAFLSDQCQRSLPQPYLLFDQPQSVLRVASIANAKWPPSNGYTMAMWLYIENVGGAVNGSRSISTGNRTLTTPSHSQSQSQSDSGHRCLHLLSIESDDGKSLLDLLYNPILGSLTLRTQSKSSYVFSGVKLLPQTWHHIAIVHSSSFLAGSWFSLYINGVHKFKSNVQYVGKSGSSASISAVIGGVVSQTLTQSQSQPVSGDNSPSLMNTLSVGVDGKRDSLTVPASHSPSLPPRPRSNSVSVTATTMTMTEETNSETAALVTSTLSAAPLSSRQAHSHSRRATNSGIAVNPRWRLASCLLVEDIVADGVVKALYECGPRVSAIVSSASRPVLADPFHSLHALTNNLNTALDAVNREAVRAASSAVHSAVSSADDTTVAALVKRPVTALVDTSDVLTKSSLSHYETNSQSLLAVVPYDRVLFCYHACNGADASAPFPTTVTNNVRQLDWTVTNIGPAGIVSDGKLSSGCSVVIVRPLADRIKQVGGIRRLLSLIAKCSHTTENFTNNPALALRHSLLLLASALKRQPENLLEMRELNGYRILGHLLKLISKRHQRTVPLEPEPSPFPTIDPISGIAIEPPSEPVRSLSNVSNTDASTNTTTVSLFDPAIVEVCLSLCGLSDNGATGTITQHSAFESLIIDFGVWCSSTYETQAYLFQSLLHAISINPNKSANIRDFREYKVVGWLMSLVSDSTVRSDIIVQAVAIISELWNHSHHPTHTGAKKSKDKQSALTPESMEILSKLQLKSNEQRLLRRQQRAIENERIAEAEWQACQQQLLVMSMAYADRELRQPPVYEKLVGLKRKFHSENRNDNEDEMLVGDDCDLSASDTQSDSGADYDVHHSLLKFRQPWRIDSTEGPARARRRLTRMTPLTIDAPIFTHPYKLWEEDRDRKASQIEESALVSSDNIVAQTNDSDDDADNEADSDSDIDGESLSRSGSAMDLAMPMTVEAEEVEVQMADTTNDTDSDTTTVSITADGELVSEAVNVDPSEPATVVAVSLMSPRVRQSLSVNTDKWSNDNDTEAVRNIDDPSDLSDLTGGSGRSFRPAASPVSTTSTHSGGSGRVATRDRGHSSTLDSIPAAVVEPRMRKIRHQVSASIREIDLSSTNDDNNSGSEGGTVIEDCKTVENLPTSPPIDHTASAPVVRRSMPLMDTNTANENAAILAGDSDSKPPLSSPSSVLTVTINKDKDSETQQRPRVVGRQRSLTADDANEASVLADRANSATGAQTGKQSLSASSSSHALNQLDKQSQSPGSVSLLTGEEDIVGDDDYFSFLEEERLKLLMRNDDIVYHYNCLRVDGMDEIRGILCFCHRALYLIDQYQINKDGAIVKLPSDSSYGHHYYSSHCLTDTEHSDGAECREWKYTEVSEAAKRRYLLRPAALELFFTDGRTHLLLVNVDQREAIYNNLAEFCPRVKQSRFALTSQLNLFSTGDTIDGNTAQSYHTVLAPITKLWQLGELSNFDYLMALNSVAGRTYNDLTQYPVMPWILRDYDSPTLNLHDPTVYRDLSRPMGALTEPRAAIFRQRYKDSESLCELDPNSSPYHYGTHYSTAAVVLYYLLRCEPFTRHVIDFQSGRFDRPDRLFHSIKQSYVSASQQNVMDVKELIPEFFCFPEFLVNGNRLNLGVRQDSQRVNDVLLPRWSRGSSRQFVRLHRAALESDYVSAHLHHWIDLIFGYKQQGNEAVTAQNVFYYLTYAGRVDIDEISDPMVRSATIEQIRSFGQTPTQLFHSPHPTKRVSVRPSPLFRSPLLRKFTVVKHEMVAHSVTGLYVSEADHRVFVARPGVVIVPVTNTLSLSSQHGIQRFATIKRHRSQSLHKSKHSPSFIAYGFTDNTVRVGSMTGNVSAATGFTKLDSAVYGKAFVNLHSTGTGCVAVSEIDCGLVVTSGSEDCTVKVWSDFALIGTLYGHRAPVTTLAVSRAQSLVVSGSGSDDSTVCLWDLNRMELVRQLRIVPGGSVITAISILHSTGLIAIASRAPDLLSLVDVNGRLLAQYPDVRRSTPSQSQSAKSKPIVNGHARSRTSFVQPNTHHHAHTRTTTVMAAPPVSRTDKRQTSQSLSFTDTVCALHIVDVAGHQLLNSLCVILTGHASGKVRVWYCTFEPMPLSTVTLQQSKSSSTPSPLQSPPLPPPSSLAPPTNNRQQFEKDSTDANLITNINTDTDTNADNDSNIDASKFVRIHSLPLPSASDANTDPPVSERVQTAPFMSPPLPSPLLSPSVSASPSDPSALTPSGSSLPSPIHAGSGGDSKPVTYQGDLHVVEDYEQSEPYMPTDSNADTDTTSDGDSHTTSDSSSEAPHSWYLRPIQEWQRHTAPVTALHVNTECTTVWSGDTHGTVLQWQCPLSEEAKHSVSGLTGVAVPPADSACLCKPSSTTKGGNNRHTMKRYCAAHSQTCKQVVCDQCVLEHLRHRHSPQQHRVLLRQHRTKSLKKFQMRAAAVAAKSLAASANVAAAAAAAAAEAPALAQVQPHTQSPSEAKEDSAVPAQLPPQ